MISDFSIRRCAFALVASLALLLPGLARAASNDVAPSGTKLTLINGWKNTPYGTSKATVSVLNGIVHLQGSILTSGTSADPFILPFRSALRLASMCLLICAAPPTGG